MDEETNTQDLFRQYGLIEALIYLYRKGQPIQRVEYRTQVGLGGATAMRVHEKLYRAGLIEAVPNPSKLLFALTEKGNKVAEMLYVVMQILEDKINPIILERAILSLQRILDEYKEREKSP